MLYLDYENPSFAIRDRIDLMTGEIVSNLHVWGTWIPHQPPQIGSELLATVAKESRPLIFVDPFRYSHSAEENDSTEMMGVMQQLRYYASVGCAVVILHHPAKTEGSTGRGSSSIRAAADVAFLQEMRDSHDGGLITLKCGKNRFGEAYLISVRPDFETGHFELVDSPEFTKRTNEVEKLVQIIAKTPGLSQNSLWKRSGMMKKRFVDLIKENRGALWREVKDGNSLCYFPTCSHKRTAPRTTEQVKGFRVVLLFSPLGENREQSLLDPLVVPRTGAQKSNSKISTEIEI